MNKKKCQKESEFEGVQNGELLHSRFMNQREKGMRKKGVENSEGEECNAVTMVKGVAVHYVSVGARLVEGYT